MKNNNKITQLKYKEIPELRERLLKEQNNICPICNKQITKPVLDHHHVKRIKGSGLVRGCIDNLCNIMLGKIENNCVRYSIQQSELPYILRNMAQYLEREPLPYMHPSEAPKPLILKKSSYNALKKKAQDKKFPEYPKSGKLTKKLEVLFSKFEIAPEFYKEKNNGIRSQKEKTKTNSSKSSKRTKNTRNKKRKKSS